MLLEIWQSSMYLITHFAFILEPYKHGIPASLSSGEFGRKGTQNLRKIQESYLNVSLKA